jgi:hypothetical protein
MNEERQRSNIMKFVYVYIDGIRRFYLELVCDQKFRMKSKHRRLFRLIFGLTNFLIFSTTLMSGLLSIVSKCGLILYVTWFFCVCQTPVSLPVCHNIIKHVFYSYVCHILLLYMLHSCVFSCVSYWYYARVSHI